MRYWITVYSLSLIHISGKSAEEKYVYTHIAASYAYAGEAGFTAVSYTHLDVYKRQVFSFRPNLKNPEHEKAWQLLMEIPTGQRNQYLVDVILEQEERETLKRLIQEAVREELKCGDVERMPAQEKEEIPGHRNILRHSIYQEMNTLRLIHYLLRFFPSRKPELVFDAIVIH